MVKLIANMNNEAKYVGAYVCHFLLVYIIYVYVYIHVLCGMSRILKNILIFILLAVAPAQSEEKKTLCGIDADYVFGTP